MLIGALFIGAKHMETTQMFTNNRMAKKWYSYNEILYNNENEQTSTVQDR